jgi:hypothetical protein
MLFARITLQLGLSAAMAGCGRILGKGKERERETDARQKERRAKASTCYFTRFLTRRTRGLLVCVILKLPLVKVPRSSKCLYFFSAPPNPASNQRMGVVAS